MKTDEQVALMAAVKHKKGKVCTSSNDVLLLAEFFYKWLKEKQTKNERTTSKS